LFAAHRQSGNRGSLIEDQRILNHGAAIRDPMIHDPMIHDPMIHDPMIHDWMIHD